MANRILTLLQINRDKLLPGYSHRVMRDDRCRTNLLTNTRRPKTTDGISKTENLETKSESAADFLLSGTDRTILGCPPLLFPR